MQTIYQKARRSCFTTIPNELIGNPNLSMKAKGILIYLLSKPSDWQTRIEDIIDHSTDGRAAVLSGLKELQKAGYMRKERVVDPQTKRVIAWRTLVFDEPQSQNTKTDILESQNVESQNLENRTLLNTDLLKTELPKTDIQNQSLPKSGKSSESLHGDTEPEQPYVTEPEEVSEPAADDLPVNRETSQESNEQPQGLQWDKSSAAQFAEQRKWSAELPPWRSKRGPNGWAEEMLAAYVARGRAKGWSCDRSDAVGYFANCEAKARRGEMEAYEKAIALCDELRNRTTHKPAPRPVVVPTLAELTDEERTKNLEGIERVRRMLAHAS